MGKNDGIPSNKYGHISFHKDGRVTKHEKNLSKNSKEKEKQIIELFVNSLKSQGRNIILLEDKDNPYDGFASENYSKIIFEVTEFADGAFLSTDPDQPSGAYKINREKLDQGLKNAIEKKVSKHYSVDKNSKFFLIIFCASSLASPKYLTQSGEVESIGGKVAREYLIKLAKEDSQLFDEIWFFYPSNLPIKIWPIEALAGVTKQGDVALQITIEFRDGKTGKLKDSRISKMTVPVVNKIR